MSHTKVLVIKDLLGLNGVGKIGGTTSKRSISHNDNKGVLLDVEWARIETPFPIKSSELSGGNYLRPYNPERVSYQQGDNGSNGDGRGSEGK